MNVSVTIPYEVAYILFQMQKSGFEIYLVGGAVRDLLISSLESLQSKSTNSDTYFEIADYDFATNATPSQIQQVFPDSYYTNQFGMVGIAYQNINAKLISNGFVLPKDNIASRIALNHQPKPNRVIDLASATKIHSSLSQEALKATAEEKSVQLQPPPFEITTYRSEGIYSDFRRPDEVAWGDSIQQDLERRDFTINAMALSISQNFLEKIFSKHSIRDSLITINQTDYNLIDPQNGLKDLAKQLIVTVRNPNERFEEDALRMLRAIRLSCQLDFEIEAMTFNSIKEHSQLLTKISWERIQTEFLKMLSSDQPAKGIQLLDKTSLLAIIMPEIITCKGVEQGGHHDTDVWTHSLESLQNCPSTDPMVRLAALLHDIGKPRTYQLRNGEITFYNHEIVSSRIADQIAKRLKLSNQQREKLFKLVRFHMFHYQPKDTDAAIRRMIKRVGLQYIDDILDLREGDRLGSGAKRTSWRLEELKQRIVEQLNQPTDTNDLAIDGHDLIKELGLKPGRVIGEILNHLLELVIEKPELNTKQNLIKEAEKFIEPIESDNL